MRKVGVTSSFKYDNSKLQGLSKSKVIEIGIFEEEKARIGEVHELGLGDMPRRSFLRDPIDNASKKIENQLAELAQGVDEPPQKDNILHQVGQWIVDDIVASAFTANHNWLPKEDGTPATLGDLKDSIRARVKDVK